MEFQDTSHPIARKSHRCEYCGKTIEKGEKYSLTVGKDGDFYNIKLCLVCEAISDAFNLEEHCLDPTWDYVTEWLQDKYCLDCPNRSDDCKVRSCPTVRKHFQ